MYRIKSIVLKVIIKEKMKMCSELLIWALPPSHYFIQIHNGNFLRVAIAIWTVLPAIEL